MPEARDRILRPDATAELFARQRSVGIGILVEEPGRGSSSLGSPFPWGNASMTASRRPTLGPMGMGRARFRTPRLGDGRGRLVFGSPYTGGENNTAGTGRRGRGGRPGNSPLPSWYPRTPLRDITGVMRAIERRRARLREAEGLQLNSPTPQEPNAHDPALLPISIAPLEHEISTISPNPATENKPYPPHISCVPRILLGVNTQTSEDYMTPQKKLLNSIDQVEKVMKEEFQKMKRTPTAKKAEREKKVRTLMTFR